MKDIIKNIELGSWRCKVFQKTRKLLEQGGGQVFCKIKNQCQVLQQITKKYGKAKDTYLEVSGYASVVSHIENTEIRFRIHKF